MAADDYATLRPVLRDAAQDWTDRYQYQDCPRELAWAIDTFRWLYRAAPSALMAAACTDLIVVLQFEFERSGDLASISEAIELGERAVREVTSESRRARQSANLGNAYRLRYEAAGARFDLECAVLHGRRGLDESSSAVVQARRLSNLSFALRLRYELLDRLQDLREAILLGDRALDAVGSTQPERSRMASNLSIALRLYGVACGDADVLRESLQLALDATNLPSSLAIDRAGLLINAGLAAAEIARVTGTVRNLRQAEEMLQRAADIADAAHADRRTALINLALVARARAALAAATRQEIDHAVDRSANATAVLAPNDPDAVMCWSGLGRAYWTRFDRLKASGDARRAVDARLTAARQRLGSPGQRTISGRIAGEWAMAIDDPTCAVEGYQLALDRLHELIWPGLQRDERERRLTDLAGLADDAAGACIAAGRGEDAVRCSEHGRSVLWEDRLRTGDVDRLASVDPALAERLLDVRGRLEALEALHARSFFADEPTNRGLR